MGDARNSFYRLPLANHLFEDRPLFADIIERFPDCQPIVPRLRSLQGETLEAALEDLQINAEAYPRGRRQLAAVRCYLHQVITGCENGWRDVAKGVTNYKSLLDQIERTYPKEPVCLVTFNYDTLLEDALRQFELPITSIEDYTKRHPFYRVFKLHGSLNWARELETNARIEMAPNTATVFAQLMKHWDAIHITDRYHFSAHDAAGVVSGKPMFPAIAIPVEKKRSFECPPHLIEELKSLMPDARKVLVIGWRATEAHFLDLLKNYLRAGVHLYIVSGPRGPNGEEPGEAVKVSIYRALLNNRPGSVKIDEGGFSDFMLGRRAEQFLGN